FHCGILPIDGLKYHLHRLEKRRALCSRQSAFENHHTVVIVVPTKFPCLILGLILLRLVEAFGPGIFSYEFFYMLSRAMLRHLQQMRFVVRCCTTRHRTNLGIGYFPTAKGLIDQR